MIAESDAASIFRGTQGSGSIEISAPGAFTAVGFSGQQKNPRASAAERGRPSLFKTIDEDRRERHDHINRSGRATYPRRISVQTSGATPELVYGSTCHLHVDANNRRSVFSNAANISSLDLLPIGIRVSATQAGGL
jgi:hypothetical protein